MPNDNTKYVYIQIAISLLTLFLTPLFSGIVVSFQLSKQHQLWVEQRKIIKSDDIQTKKVQLVNDLEKAFINYVAVGITIDLAHLENIVLYAKGKYADDTKLLFIDSFWGLRPDSKEYEKAIEKFKNSIFNLLDAYSQLKSHLGLVPTVFSNKVADKTKKVEEALALSLKAHVSDANQINELILKQEKIEAEFIKTRNIVQYSNSLPIDSKDETLTREFGELLGFMRAEFEN